MRRRIWRTLTGIVLAALVLLLMQVAREEYEEVQALAEDE